MTGSGVVATLTYMLEQLDIMTWLKEGLKLVSGPGIGAIFGYLIRCWQKRYKAPKFVSLDAASKYHLFGNNKARVHLRIHNLNDYPVTICGFSALATKGLALKVSYFKNSSYGPTQEPMIITARDVYEAQFHIMDLPSKYPQHIDLKYVDHSGKMRTAIRFYSPIVGV